MPEHSRSYTDRPTLWRPRVALEVTRHGLTERFALGRSRTTLWHHMRGVRWIRHDVAEITRGQGRPIRLTARIADLKSLVATVDREAAAAQQDWREHGLPADLVCDWLGVRPGGQWVDDPNPGSVRVGLLLVVVAAAMLHEAWWWQGAMLLIGSCVLLYAGLSRSQPVVTADSHGITWRWRGITEAVAWPEVVGMEVMAERGRASTTVGLRLDTAHGSYEVSGAPLHMRALTRTCGEVVQANTARLRRLGRRAVPDSALSPARLTGDAERGLSQSE